MSKEKSWKEIPMGGLAWKNSWSYSTGEWRTFKPEVDHDKCIKCMLCVMYCPDMSISYKKEEDKIEFDFEHCKGCGVCAEECPVNAITMKKEK
jgi:pyruvate ferredoxin oxidoreductase delta subunit